MKREREIWAPVDGTEGRYEVSSYGRVRSYCNYRHGLQREPHVLKPGDLFGYSIVTLIYPGNKRVTARVHRLVAKAFIPNPHNYPEIDHINTHRSDNHYTNLRWVERKQNCQNPVTRTRVLEFHKKMYHPVAQVYNGKVIRTFESYVKAAQECGIWEGNISRAVRKGIKAGGFNWRAL